MGYYAFKIVRLPEIVDLRIETGVATSDPVVLNKVYPMNREYLILTDFYNNVPGVPYDYFTYQIQREKRGEWSGDINMELNVEVDGNTFSCLGPTLVEAKSSKTINIDSLFKFDNSVDRLKVTEIVGDNNILVNGQPLEIGAPIMRNIFTNVTFKTELPKEGSYANHAVISYVGGTKDQWFNEGSPCQATIQRIDYASILADNYNPVGKYPNYENGFTITGGIPGTYVKVRLIETSGDLGAIYVNQTINGVNTVFLVTETPDNVDIYITENGQGYFTISGTVPLVDSNVPWYRSVTAEILSSNDNPLYVDQDNKIATTEIYNDPFDIDQDPIGSLNVIIGVELTSANFAPTVDTASGVTESGTIDVNAKIKQFVGYGTAPFTYGVASVNTDGTITQVTDTNEFNITTMGGLELGQTHNFVATVTDANGIVSTRSFTVIVYDKTLVSVPTVTGPSTIDVLSGQDVNAQIVATNEPIISYAAISLPSSLSLNTTTGVISGTDVDDPAGVYNVTLTATNSVGVSAGFNLAITITDPVTSAPNLTSSTVYDIHPITGAVAYEITYTGTAPITVAVTSLPSGWYYHSGLETVYGTSDGSQTFRVELSNLYGTDFNIITGIVT